MKSRDLDKLIDELKEAIVAARSSVTIGIVGYTSAAFEVIERLDSMQLLDRLKGGYTSALLSDHDGARWKPLSQLQVDHPEIVVIASDEDKEALLVEALPYLRPDSKILIGGFAHFGFQDALFETETRNALIPSLANGYPNSLIHIFQCLKNAARLNLDGIVVEFGMFKGGTTMLMSRFIEGLGQNWKIFGFDSFAGFPPARSPLDMYAHADCVFLDEALVRRVFDGRNVEVVAGDILETVNRIREEAIVLAFVDTDNFSSANAILDVIQDRVVVGGAIVFDHFAGRDRFVYTLGERIAAKRLLLDDRYFNLHDTGVFLRQR